MLCYSRKNSMDIYQPSSAPCVVYNPYHRFRRVAA